MKNYTNRMVCLIAGLIFILPTACYHAGKTSMGPTNDKMLMDGSGAAAPHALVTLQERPVFQVDDMKRPIAMEADSIKKTRTADKPLTIQESKPE
jgi:hypothetical protein